MARKSQYPPSVKPGIPKKPHLPQGWRFQSFGDVLEVVERPAKLQDNQEYQLVTAKRSRGGIVPRERLLGEQILTKTQYYTNAGDFLISRRQIIHGACGLVPPELDGAIVSNEYSTLLTKSDLLTEYLAYFSHTTYFQQTCFQSSVGVDVEKMIFKLDDWLNYKIPLPPLSEQKQIADILSSVDEAIASTQAVIDQTCKVKQGLLQQLLTRGIDHTKFKESAIGEIPELWEIGTLGTEIGKLDSGWSPVCDSSPASGDEWGVLKTTAVVWSGYVSSENKRLPNNLTPRPQAEVQKDDILITRKGPVERVGVVVHVPETRDKLMIPDTVLRIRLKEKSNLLPEFVPLALESRAVQNDWKGKKIGLAEAQVNINTTILRQTIIPIPSHEEQSKIVELLKSVDNSLKTEEQKLLALSHIKRGLMQDLLTGKVRVGCTS